MHELSLVTSLWEIVDQEMQSNNYQRLIDVEIEIGSILGVLDDYLISCFDLLKIDSAAACQATLTIRQIPTIIECNLCKNTWNYEDHWYICPTCNHADSKAISGKELKILSLQVE